MELLLTPFKWLLIGLNSLSHNYGVAILLFAFVVNAVLLPFNAKGKKGMLKMTRLQPKVKELEKKYGDNAQKKAEEMQKLYKEEGASTTGGCLWTLIPLPIMIGLYQLIIRPFTRIMDLTDAQFSHVKSVIDYLGFAPDNSGNAYYEQIRFAQSFHEYFGDVMARINSETTAFGRELAELLSKYTAQDVNFSFLRLDLAQTPTWKVWEWADSPTGITWAVIGLFLLPLISASISVVSMMISQKMQGSEQAVQQNKSMMLVSPIISLWIGFSMPGLMSLYWVGNGVCQALKDFVLTRHYKAILDVEDAARDAVRSAREAELEAKRQETLLLKAEGEVIDNPNLSKKKKEQLEKEERERKKREWEENSGRKKAVKNAGSGVSEAAVGDRPYARGRAYKEERYNRSGVKLLAEADTELEAKTVEVVDAQIDVKVTTEVVEASAETIVDAVVETTDGKTNKKSKKRELTAGGIVEIPVESEEEK